MTDIDYPINCPVDDCDRGPFDNENALRGHVNASAGNDHEWQKVEAQLEATEGAEAGDGGDEPQGNDAEEGEQNDMPTQQEYQEQHADDGDGDDGDDTSGASPVAALPMDPVTLGLLLAVAVGLWLTYRTLSSDDGDETIDVDATETDAGTESAADESEIITGGLTG